MKQKTPGTQGEKTWRGIKTKTKSMHLSFSFSVTTKRATFCYSRAKQFNTKIIIHTLCKKLSYKLQLKSRKFDTENM